MGEAAVGEHVRGERRAARGGAALPGWAGHFRRPFPLLSHPLRLCEGGLGLCFRESEDEGGHAAGARPSACPYTPSHGPQSCPGCPARWPRGTSFSGHKGCAATPGSGCPPSRETLPPPVARPPPPPGHSPPVAVRVAQGLARTHTSRACRMSQCTPPQARRRANARTHTQPPSHSAQTSA